MVVGGLVDSDHVFDNAKVNHTYFWSYAVNIIQPTTMVQKLDFMRTPNIFWKIFYKVRLHI